MGAGLSAKLLKSLGLERPEARAWALYDWANSAMWTVVVTAVYPVYFQKVAAADLPARLATERHAWATTAALAFVALLAPFLGTIADVRACKKRFLAGFAAIGIAATAGLFFVDRGDQSLGLMLFVLANVGAAGSTSFYDALLPHVAPEEELHRLSSVGFALGYLGGGLLLGLNLLWILRPAWFGLPHGDGLSPSEGTLPTRLAFLSVAIWWAVFTLPLMRKVKEPSRTLEMDELAGAPVLRTALQRLGETLRELRSYRDAFLMLAAFLIYNDGILTIIRMATIYATERELDRSVVIGAILLVQFVGIPFSLLFGRLARRFAARSLVLASLAIYALIALLAYRMTTVTHFLVLALLVATVQGGSQALSRSLFASMVPKHKSGQFFALFSVGEKFAGIFGPGLFAIISSLTGSSEKAILSVLAFFVIGGLLLSRVNVERGRRAAQAAEARLRATA